MKAMSLRTIAAAIVMMLGIAVAEAKDYFGCLMKRSDVEVVYVSKALISTVRPNLNVGNIHLGGQFKNIESIYVINSSSQAGIKACLKVVDDFVDGNRGIEVLMKSKDAKDETVLYGLPDRAEEGGYSKLVICNSNPNDVSIVVVAGNVTLGNTPY